MRANRVNRVSRGQPPLYGKDAAQVGASSRMPPGRCPSGSRYPPDIGSVRGRAGHHCAGELLAFARARTNESLLRFAHEGIDGAGRAIVPGAITIAPADCTGLIAVVRCGQHAKELRLRDGFGELRRQTPPMIGAGRLLPRFLPIPTSLPRPSVRRGLRNFFQHQPLRIEAGQRVAFQAFLPDQIRRCRKPTVHGDSGATELSCQIPATEEFLQGAGRRHRWVITIDPLPDLKILSIVKRSDRDIKVSASPQLIE